jgi:hypothetical protein
MALEYLFWRTDTCSEPTEGLFSGILCGTVFQIAPQHCPDAPWEQRHSCGSHSGAWYQPPVLAIGLKLITTVTKQQWLREDSLGVCIYAHNHFHAVFHP